MKLEKRCPKCNKLWIIEKEFSMLGKQYEMGRCGHTISAEIIPIPENRCKLWSKARPYQQEGVEFIERANYNCLLADDMGLGKTIQAILAVKYAREDILPCVVVVKSAIKYNWAKELLKWYDEKTLFQIVTSGKSKVLPGFQFYIVSMDNLAASLDQLIALDLKCMIVDECHNFKSPTTNRTVAMLKLRKEIPHCIFLSGTPILNRAPEYFTVLNSLHPEVFPYRVGFERQWCQVVTQGNTYRYGGIKPHKKDLFADITKRFVLRRLKREVQNDLPPFESLLTIVEIEDPQYIRMYGKQQRELADFCAAANMSKLGLSEYSNLLAILARMRETAGLAKVKYIANRVQEFLESENTEPYEVTEKEATEYQMIEGTEIMSHEDKTVVHAKPKICIGVHHQSVMRNLSAMLRDYRPLLLTGAQSAEEKFNTERKFKHPSNRVMIASTLAGGEGMNFQFCSNAILAERQWNRAKELQFQDRFDRFGSLNKGSMDYIIARGSIDEWMTILVEKKDQYVRSALKSNREEDQPSMDIKELAQMVLASGGLGNG